MFLVHFTVLQNFLVCVSRVLLYCSWFLSFPVFSVSFSYVQSVPIDFSCISRVSKPEIWVWMFMSVSCVPDFIEFTGAISPPPT